MSYVMASPTKRPTMLSFRASADEIARVDQVVERIRRTHPFMNRSDVLRELAGLTEAGLSARLRGWVVNISMPDPDDPFDGLEHHHDGPPDDPRDFWERHKK